MKITRITVDPGVCALESPASGGSGSRSRDCLGCWLPAARASKSSPIIPTWSRETSTRPYNMPPYWRRTRRSNWRGEILVDMPLPPALARWLATQGHDAVHASAIGLGRSADAEILTRAREDTRTVVTADLDYPRLLALAGAEGPSLILFRGGGWSEADILNVIGEGAIARSIVVVDRTRVRRRRLPIV
jgi:predicted nuclease of predicted toxin-antitoxin system